MGVLSSMFNSSVVGEIDGGVLLQAQDVKVRPAVGVGVMIRRENQVLLGRRIGVHGAGSFGWPGGHVEFGETLEETIKREAFEEAGLIVKQYRLICVSNVIEYSKHYLDLQFEVTSFEGTPQVNEPHRIDNWDWYDLDNLPEPLFKPCQFAISSLKSGIVLNDDKPTVPITSNNVIATTT